MFDEASFCEDVVALVYHDDCEWFPEISRPRGAIDQKIPGNKYNELLSFFVSEVVPFSNMLSRFSKELEGRLDFDMHSIFSVVASESERIINLGERLLSDVKPSISKIAKELFRFLLWPMIRKSYFVSRGLLKPHGFPGDYVIVEEMYQGNPKSAGLGYIYDAIFLQTQLCQGLRNRKEQMKQILLNFIASQSDDFRTKMTLFNVGCGGSRELRELPLENYARDLIIYLLDFDDKALGFSVSQISANSPRIRLMPINADVRQLISPEGFAKLNIGSCDLIYSIGLFDYLPDKVLARLLINLRCVLSKKGKLIFAHKDHTVYDPKIADWFCDWNYYPRSQRDFLELLKSGGVEMDSVSFSREKDGYIFFGFMNNE